MKNIINFFNIAVDLKLWQLHRFLVIKVKLNGWGVQFWMGGRRHWFRGSGEPGICRKFGLGTIFLFFFIDFDGYYIVRTDEGQPRPKYIFNKCGTNIYFFYITEF